LKKFKHSRGEKRSRIEPILSQSAGQIRKAASTMMRPFLMSCILGEDRGHAALLPAVIEDYVAADAAVRVPKALIRGIA
jgi:hypothetical protein